MSGYRTLTDGKPCLPPRQYGRSCPSSHLSLVGRRRIQDTISPRTPVVLLNKQVRNLESWESRAFADPPIVWCRWSVLGLRIQRRDRAWANLRRSARGNDWRAFQPGRRCRNRSWTIYVIRWRQRVVSWRTPGDVHLWGGAGREGGQLLWWYERGAGESLKFKAGGTEEGRAEGVRDYDQKLTVRTESGNSSQEVKMVSGQAQLSMSTRCDTRIIQGGRTKMV